MRGRISIARYDGGTGLFNKKKRYNQTDKINMYISSTAKKILNCTSVVISIKDEILFIRRAGIDDVLTHTVSTGYNLGVGLKYDSYIGEYYIELEEEGQDEFELIPYEND